MPNAFPRYCIIAFFLSLGEPTLLLGEFIHKYFAGYVSDGAEKVLIQTTSGLTLILGIWAIWKLIPPTLKVVTVCTNSLNTVHTSISEAGKNFDSFLYITVRKSCLAFLNKVGVSISSFLKKVDDTQK
jgi:hypothetical protein